MTQLSIGSLLISLLHAVIPNHWLPVLAIGRKEGWSLAETSRVTFIAGMAHVISTVIIGILLAMIGSELTYHIDHFAHVIGPSVLILIGLYFVQQHYKHHHSEPVGIAMIVVAIVNTLTNFVCVKLLQSYSNKGAHIKASIIFTGNDMVINLGIVLSGITVMIFKSPIPDLVIGLIVAGISIKGGIEILKEARKETEE